LYQLLKPILFLFSAETAHHLTLQLFAWSLKIPILNSIVLKDLAFDDDGLAIEQFGVLFKNPVGLAAGFDKNASYLHLMEKLGFGFIEVGTVTPKAQLGNDKPRLFRLKKDTALINRMGFNNEGLAPMVERLKQINLNVTIGGNLGKNKTTPNEQAVEDYKKGFNALYPYVDYFVVNVSSPNTPGLRDLQDKEPLTKIINALAEINEAKAYPKPILLKIAPDLNQNQLDDIIDIINGCDLSGLITTNTTISRADLITNKSEIDKIGNGGLSGAPVFKKSNEVLAYLKSKLPKDYPIIGVGGIVDADTAMEKMNLGSALIQIYSGLVFYGPTLVKDVLLALKQKKKEAEENTIA